MVTIYLSNGIFSLSLENTCQKSGKIKKKLIKLMRKSE